MDAEIITIGDELLTGHTVDTNAAVIAEQLTNIGLSVRSIYSIGDSVERIEEAIRQAVIRSQVVIATGGLGPTDDDITKKAIVKAFKRNLVFHEDVLDNLKARFAGRGIKMPAINQNQALLPQGATFFPNRNGSAVGICIAEEGFIFIALPGVPMEMNQILVDEVVPHLKGLKTRRTVKVIKLRTTGIVESKLAELIAPDLKLANGVRLGYLPSFSGVDLRVIVEGDEEEEVKDKALELVRYLERTAGRYIYGRDSDSLEGVVGHLLADNDRTLSVTESCTGGQLGMLITSVPGSSGYFVGGLQAYSNNVKVQQLKVSEEMLVEHGAVSEECALEMAESCRKLFGSDYALSITGIAGPDGGSDDKPVGATFIGLATAHGVHARRFSFGTDRQTNRSRACYAALELLRREILDIK